MKEDIRQATKAQAQAVRAYLRTLGCELTHTQALEVLARGQGMRSRHVLAASVDTPAPAAPTESPERGHLTQVAYRYVDGSNCKRYGQMLFRGRLTPRQLEYIQHKMDDGLYFVPAQVGFENLALAFTDFGGDDHGWHTLELSDREAWQLDSDGYVLDAGDVTQVVNPSAGSFATDADTNNLFFRFARVKTWVPEAFSELLREQCVEGPGEVEVADQPEEAVALGQWRSSEDFAGVSDAALRGVHHLLVSEGFKPAQSIGKMLEWRREVTPWAYQFVILQPCDSNLGDLALNVDVSTTTGDYVTESPLLFWAADNDRNADVRAEFDRQLRSAHVDPQAWGFDA